MYRRMWGRPAKGRRRLRLALLVIVLILLLLLAEKQFAPIIGAAAAQKCHSLALTAINQAIQQELTENPDFSDYQQMIQVERDQNGRISLLIPNSLRINQLNADLTLRIDQALNQLGRQSVAIPLGAASGSSLLAATGPNIDVGFVAAAAPSVSLSDQFTSAGINQTKHSLTLHITVDLLVTAPFDREKITVSTSVLLAEGIIVGDTPEGYAGINTASPQTGNQ